MENMMVMMGETEEQRKAAELHFEILAACRVVADSLLDLGRKLKQMRDTKGYRELGFENFERYTEMAVGIKQRQAYTYIGIVETLPAQLIEQNAAAGVTKLAILGQIGRQEQQEVLEETGDLTRISVKELQALVDSKKMLGEQLSLMEEENRELREKEAAEIARADLVAAQEAEIAKITEKAMEEAEKKIKAAQEQAKKDIAEAKKEAERRAREETAKDIAKAREDALKELELAKEEAAKAATEAQIEKTRLELEAAREAERQARQKAEEAAKELKLATDGETMQFSLYFDRMRDEVKAMKDMAARMRENGKEEQAGKLMKALKGALLKVAEGIE